MQAGTYNTVVEEGRDLVRAFIWKDVNGSPIDLSRYSEVRYAIKGEFGEVTVIEVNSTDDPSVISMGPPASSGEINLNIPGGLIGYIQSLNGRYKHELAIVDDAASSVVALLIGKVVFRRAIV